MRKPLLILALAGEVLFGGTLSAQDTQSPWKIETLRADGEIRYDLQSGEMRANNGVRIRYKQGTPDETELTSEQATLHQASGQIVASGNAVLRRDGTIWKASRLEYNFRTKKIGSAQFRTGTLAVYLKGETMTGNQTNGVYRATNTILTTDDVDDPAFFIKAKEVEVIPGEHAIFRQATVYLGRTPVFYLPYYKRSFKRHPWNIHTEPGYKSEWGGYLLNAVRWPSTDGLSGELNLDYRSARGFAMGPRIEYDMGRWGEGQLNLYRAWDDDPLTDSRNIAIDRERDLAQWAHRLRTGTLSTTAVVEYESDEYFRRDFFEESYRNNIQPNTYLEIAKHWDNYHLDLLAQPRVNNFYESVERLPEIRLSGTRHQLGDSPFYYDTQSSLGYLRRRYNFNSSDNDYGLMRFDTLHQVYLPKTYGGWLNYTPRIGGRFTRYGDTEGPGSTKTASERFVLSTGVELSTKFSKVMPELKSQLLGIDGARHIIQPSINYAFIPRPNRIPNELDQLDYEITSPRLLPIHMPEYNAIDNIDSQNVVRFSLRNRLQTKRNNQIVDAVDWGLYTDWRADPNSNQTTFADVFSDAYLRPRDWLTVNSGLRYDIDNSLWRTVSHGASIAPRNHQWNINAGHYYYLAHPSVSTADRTDVYYSGLGYRINEDWSFSTRQYYDAKAGEMAQHDYILHKDMRSWTFFIDLTFRKSTGRRDNEMGISFNYSLKPFPRKPSID